MTHLTHIKDQSGTIIKSIVSTFIVPQFGRFPDLTRLSFKSASRWLLPAGSTIDVNGEVYSLLQDYAPMEEGDDFLYTLEFHTKWYRWTVKPEHFRGTDAVIVNDPSGTYFQHTLKGFMEGVKRGLRDDLNEDFTYQIPETTTRETVCFPVSGVAAALTCISREWGLQWSQYGNVIILKDVML